MSMVRYEPWVGVRQLQDDINRLFSGLSTGDSSSVTADWVPSVDINELEDKFALYIDLPGVDPKDVDITLENSVLTISGERFVRAEKADENVVRRRTERGTLKCSNSNTARGSGLNQRMSPLSSAMGKMPAR